MTNRNKQAAWVRISGRSLVACMAWASVTAIPAQPTDHIQLIYLANFANGSLSPSVDHRKFRDLQKGDGQMQGSSPMWTPKPGALELKVTKPDASDSPVSVGVFATPVAFGPGSVVEAQATFVRPSGPHAVGDVWAAAVAMRDGAAADLGGATRATVTFQVRGKTARMNVRGVNETISGTEISPAAYDAIFGDAAQPFTLHLRIDRRTGKGVAVLRSGSTAISRDVTFAAFKATTGPTITAIGAAVAINSVAAAPETASAELRELRILAPKP
jgi:hypothetical protein